MRAVIDFVISFIVFVSVLFYALLYLISFFSSSQDLSLLSTQTADLLFLAGSPGNWNNTNLQVLGFAISNHTSSFSGFSQPCNACLGADCMVSDYRVGYDNTCNITSLSGYYYTTNITLSSCTYYIILSDPAGTYNQIWINTNKDFWTNFTRNYSSGYIPLCGVKYFVNFSTAHINFTGEDYNFDRNKLNVTRNLNYSLALNSLNLRSLFLSLDYSNGFEYGGRCSNLFVTKRTFFLGNETGSMQVGLC